MEVVTTVFSPRKRPLEAVVSNHLALRGGCTRVWLNNGGGETITRQLRALAAQAGCPAIILETGVMLPIAPAYNAVMKVAFEELQATAVLELQDDVLVVNDMVMHCYESGLDLAAGWHTDREMRPYEIAGVPYVVGMAVFIKRHVWQRIGYHDEKMIRGVDADYSIRAHCSGFSTGFLMHPRVRHLGDITTEDNGRIVTQYHRQAVLMLEFMLQNGLMKDRREDVHLSEQVSVERTEVLCDMLLSS